MSNADALKEQGIALFQKSDYEAAARSFQQAQVAYEEADQPDMAAEMMVNLGLVRRQLDEPQQALELMQAALRTFEAMGDERRAAQVMGNMGGVYEALNERDNAQQHYRRAADIFRELSEEELYSDTLMAIGALQVRSGELLKGAATYQVALERRTNLTGRQRVLKFLSSNIARIARRSAGVPNLPEESAKN